MDPGKGFEGTLNSIPELAAAVGTHAAIHSQLGGEVLVHGVHEALRR
jgi:hypothetical protein